VTELPQPTRKDHQNYCLNEGWTQIRNARGKSGHHVTFELTLPDGRVLRTRISHPPNRQTYGPSMWAHILRDQLHVSEDEFWACVRERRCLMPEHVRRAANGSGRSPRHGPAADPRMRTR
jgi:hypothetical protein